MKHKISSFIQIQKKLTYNIEEALRKHGAISSQTSHHHKLS